MKTITPTDRRVNRGRFKAGFDSRRHKFSRDECVKGFWAALASIVTRFPDAVDSSGRHIACAFLTWRLQRDRAEVELPKHGNRN